MKVGDQVTITGKHHQYYGRTGTVQGVVPDKYGLAVTVLLNNGVAVLIDESNITPNKKGKQQ
jgi:ribosomal protein L21E